jgi:hypothetical protein
MHGVLASRTARVFGFAPLGHNSYAFQIFSAGVSVLNLAGRPRACVRNQASGLKHLLPPAGAPAMSSCTHYGNTCRNRRPKQRRRWPNIKAVSVTIRRPRAQNDRQRRSFPDIVAAANADGHRRSNSAIDTAPRHMAF